MKVMKQKLKVNFINNKVFSDSTLKDVISSNEYRWYEFWGSNDKFDKDRINYDKDLLKNITMIMDI